MRVAWLSFQFYQTKILSHFGKGRLSSIITLPSFSNNGGKNPFCSIRGERWEEEGLKNSLSPSKDFGLTDVMTAMAIAFVYKGKKQLLLGLLTRLIPHLTRGLMSQRCWGVICTKCISSCQWYAVKRAVSYQACLRFQRRQSCQTRSVGFKCRRRW